MSDKTTLADLAVRQAEPTNEQNDDWREVAPRSATTQDLIEAVESIGGEVVETEDHGPYATLPFMELTHGRYLILRIEENE